MLEQVEDHPRDPGLNLLFILHIHGSLTRWLNDSLGARLHEKFQNRQKIRFEALSRCNSSGGYILNNIDAQIKLLYVQEVVTHFM